MAEATPELKTYYGNCHCGAFKFNVKLPELKSVLECNCSICSRKGYQWVFPSAGNFIIEKGEGTLKDYEFGPCSMAHKVLQFHSFLFILAWKLNKSISSVQPAAQEFTESVMEHPLEWILV
jgi:hypothetical protein